MSATPQPAAVATAPTSLGELLRGLPDWLRSHVPTLVVSIVVGGLISYVSNIWLMFVRYGGWQKVPPGSPATGAGNFVGGAVFWSLATGVVAAAISYWRAVGTRRFFHDLRTLPATLLTLVRRDGQGARIHLLWGAAVSLLAAQVISPSIGALVAIGLVAATPGLLGSLISSALSRLYSLVAARVAPERHTRPVGTLGMAVGVLGSSAALVVTYFVSSKGIKWGLAAAAVAAAIALGQQAAGKSPGAGTATAVFLAVAAIAAGADLLHPLMVSANDGGQAECGIKFYQVGAWLSQCSGSHTLLAHALGGGIAGAVGAPIGAFLGAIAGMFPPGTGIVEGDGGDGWGPDRDPGPLGPGDTTPPPIVPDTFERPVRVRVSGNTIILTGPNGVSISAPINANGTVGPWSFAGASPVGPAGAPGPDTGDVVPEPSVLDPQPAPPIPEPDSGPIDGGPIDGGVEGEGLDGAGDEAGPPDTGPLPPAEPTKPAIDMVKVGSTINDLDQSLWQSQGYPQSFTDQLNAIEAHMRDGSFGANDLAALQSLQNQMDNFDNAQHQAGLAADQPFQDHGVQYMQAQDQAQLAAEQHQRDVQAQIDKQEQYLVNHIDDLPAGQYEAGLRVLNRIEANTSPDAATLGQLTQLTGAVFNLQQGASESQAAQATQDAITAEQGMVAASRIQTAAGVAEGAILFPFVVPGAAAAGADLGAFYLGRNFVQAAASGYVEGGWQQALVNGTKAVLPVNLINAIYQGDSAGQILLATVQDIGNVAQLNAAAEALHNMSPINITIGDPPKVPAMEPLPSQVSTQGDANWLRDRTQARNNVQQFQSLTEEAGTLEAAGNSGGAAAVRDQVKDLVYDMNGDFQSKNVLKGAPAELQQAFNEELNPALDQARVGTVEGLNDAGVTRGGQPLSEADLVDLRNASSAGTVGMDRDMALNQLAERQLQTQLDALPPGAPNRVEISQALEDLHNGDLVITPESHPVLTSLQEQGLLVKGTPVQGLSLPGEGQAQMLSGGQWSINGQPARPDQVRELAQEIYNSSYSQATGGHSAADAMQAVTDATHEEAYHDLNVLKNDPANTPFDPAWADQTGSVTSVKGYAATAPNGPFHNDPWNAFQEVARGTDKDINSKLLPLLQANNAPPEFVAQVQDMHSFLSDVKSGVYTPSQAQAMSYQKFGTDLQGLTNRVDAAIATSVKFGPAPPTGWSAMGGGPLATSAMGTAAQTVSGVAGSGPGSHQPDEVY